MTRLRLTIAASCLLALLGCHEDGPVVSFTPTPDVSTLGPSDVDGGQPPGDSADTPQAHTPETLSDSGAPDAPETHGAEGELPGDAVVGADGVEGDTTVMDVDATVGSDAATLETDSSDAVFDTAESSPDADADSSFAYSYDIAPPDIVLPDFGPYTCGTDDGLELFKTKVEPVVFGSQPKTCNQCHLSGIDLSMWVQDSPCQTMACLLTNGLVDLETPTDSKILSMIQMAEPDSGLITSSVINTEYVAMLEWISYSAQCHSGECGEIADPCSSFTGTVTVPEDVVNPLGLDCSDEQLVQLFHDKVYETWKGRCHGCHSKCDDPTWPAPCWLVEDVDTDDPDAMYQGALVSMYNLIGIDAIDTDNPLDSMLILKPLKQSQGGVYHGGGDKFVDTADEAYQDFALFTEQYAACYHAEEYDKPLVTMIVPSKFDKKFFIDAAVPLEGSAEDLQDGPISGGNLIWWSDLIAGPIGFGETPPDVWLPAGKQIITLEAYDSQGALGTRKLTILMKEPPPPDPP